MSPEFKKTPLMCRLEDIHQKPIDELLRGTYENGSIEAGALKLGIGYKTFRRWIGQTGIKPRSPEETNRLLGKIRREKFASDPDFKLRYQQAAKKSWQLDPEKKAQRIARAQPPGVRDIKSKKQTERWQKHPDKKEHFVTAGHQSRRADRAERMGKRLGENPHQRLEEMVQQGLSAPEIAKGIGEKSTTVTSWMQIEDLHPRKSTSLDRVTIEYRRTLVQRAIQKNLGQYLQPEDWQVIEIRYGNTGPVPSLKKIAPQLKTSKETARQREIRAFAALENLLADNPESID